MLVIKIFPLQIFTGNLRAIHCQILVLRENMMKSWLLKTWPFWLSLAKGKTQIKPDLLQIILFHRQSILGTKILIYQCCPLVSIWISETLYRYFISQLRLTWNVLRCSLLQIGPSAVFTNTVRRLMSASIGFNKKLLCFQYLY